MILSAGLSPAWQQIVTFDRLTIGEVNRATSATWCASGKVLNVGRAIQALGGAGCTLTVLGGQAGQAIRREFAADGLPATWIETRSSTRVCTTIIERPSDDPADANRITSPTMEAVPRVTELVENARPITPDELAAFEAEFKYLSESAEVVVLTGSLPDVLEQGPPVELYRRLMQHGPRAILDVRGPELQAAIVERPLLVKPNRSELAATFGRSLDDEVDVIAAMHELIKAGAGWVLVTDGPRPALLSDGRSVWRCAPPTRAVVNPIGCGDCLAAGIAVAIGDGADMFEAVRFGMAASVENLSQLLPARLTLDAVRATRDDVQFARV